VTPIPGVCTSAIAKAQSKGRIKGVNFPLRPLIRGIERGLKSYIPKSLPSAQENAIKSKYLAQRQSLDAQEADAKKYAAQAKDLVKVKYRKEQEVLERQIADARNLFVKQLKDLEDRIVVENKNLSNNRYKSGILEHKLKPYLQIRFSNYLKRALLF
jgi:hypothetical protein